MIHTHENIKTLDTSEKRKPRPNDKTFKVFVCPKCLRPFDEYKLNVNEHGTKVYYVDGFPTYGLPRKKCKNCKG